MTASIDQALGFAPDYDSPIPYMQRTREYYQAIGYAPYRWAHYRDVPFTSLSKPLAQSRILLITTAAPYQPDKGDQGPGAPYNSAAKFYKVYTGNTADDHDLRISHVGIDRRHTTATDANTWFPLPALRAAAAVGRIAGLTPRFIGTPTNRSHRATVEADIPAVLTLLAEERPDAVLLVPNCPICHQTAALTARAIEAAGTPTLVMAAAKDIVEHAGVPRLLFSDFPLGNAAGRPHDPASQAQTLEYALQLLESARAPRTTLHSPLHWDSTGAWKQDYLNLEQIGPEELTRRREEFLCQKEIARAIRTAAE